MRALGAGLVLAALCVPGGGAEAQRSSSYNLRGELAAACYRRCDAAQDRCLKTATPRSICDQKQRQCQLAC